MEGSTKSPGSREMLQSPVNKLKIPRAPFFPRSAKLPPNYIFLNYIDYYTIFLFFILHFPIKLAKLLCGSALIALNVVYQH